MFELSSVTDLSCPELDLFLVLDVSDEYEFDILVLFPDDDEEELRMHFPLALTNGDLLLGELIYAMGTTGFVRGGAD